MANEAKIVITANANQLQAVMAQVNQIMGNTAVSAQGSMAKVSQSMDGVTRSVNPLKEALSGFYGFIGGIGLGLLAKDAVSVMSSFEQLEIRMRSVMGSVAAGDKAFAWIKQFAKDTPFEVDQVAESFMKMKAFGLDPMDGTMKSVSDMAAKMGGGFESLQGISLALGQAWSKAKLQGDDINQLVERGVPVWDMLAKITGKTSAELHKLSENGQLGRGAVSALIQEMGKMSDGSAAAQMESLNGQISNFSDGIKNTLDDLRKNGGLEPIKQLFSDLNAKITELSANGTLNSWIATTAKVLQGLGTTVQVVSSLISEFGSVVIAGLAGRFLAPLAAQVAATGTAIFSFGRAALAAEGAAVAMSGGVSLLRGGMALLGGPIGTVISLVVLLGSKFLFSASEAEEASARIATASENAAKAIKDLKKEVKDGLNNPEAINQAQLQMDVLLETYRSTKAKFEEASAAAVKRSGKDMIFDRGGELRNTGLTEGLRAQKDQLDLLKSQIKSIHAEIMAAHSALAAKPKPVAPKPPGVIDSATDTTPKSQMSKFNQEFEQAKNQYAMQHDLKEMSIADEAAFWNRKLSLVAKGSDDARSIETKISQLTLQGLRQTQQEKMKAEQETIDSARQIRLKGVDVEQEAARRQLDLGKITQDQFIQQLQELENRRYQISKAAIEARIELMKRDPNYNVTELARLKNEIALLEIDHGQKTSQIQHDSMLGAAKEWESFTTMTSGLWDQGVNAMMNGTLRWNNAFKAIGMQTTAWFLKDVVGKKVKAWVVGETAQTAATTLGTAQRWIAESAAAIKSVALWAWVAIRNIANAAWEAMAGVWKAWAGSGPYGWIIGAALGAVAFAGVAALAGNIKSASGGYDIPRGVNPMVQAHSEEMILPAPLANAVRSMAASGSSGSESQGGSGGDVNVHIHAADADSVRKLLLNNKVAVADALRAAVRDGRSLK